MTLEIAKHTASINASGNRQRYFVVRLGSYYHSLNAADIVRLGISLASSPSPVMGYFDPSINNAQDYVQLQ